MKISSTMLVEIINLLEKENKAEIRIAPDAMEDGL